MSLPVLLAYLTTKVPRLSVLFAIPTPIKNALILGRGRHGWAEEDRRPRTDR